MVNQQTLRLNSVFSALSDPTRRAMLVRLAKGDASVSDLARPFAVSLPAISKHLKVLERAGLVEREVQGRVHRCRLRARPLKEAVEWLGPYRKFWQGQLDSLEAYLKRSQNT